VAAAVRLAATASTMLMCCLCDSLPASPSWRHARWQQPVSATPPRPRAPRHTRTRLTAWSSFPPPGSR
jgi:hypothetical protein